MYLRYKGFKHTIAQMQCRSLHYRALPVKRTSLAPYQPSTCQFIEGEYTKAQIKALGDAVKCGSAVQPESSYCPHHHARCYRPLTAGEDV